ncbi:MAG: DUF5979 domain-containing protein, partial [Tissierellia bacterium]|nr:DUF5979 domain-containing protein [Tissierellia bacterium]
TATNKKIETPTGDLVISKVVVGEENSDKSFEFNIVLKDKDNVELDKVFDYILSAADKILKEGKIQSGDTFQLKDGELIRIKEIPLGTKYEVTEIDPEGYVVTAENNIGEIQGEETFVKFTNTKKPEEPETPPETPETPEEPEEPEEPEVPETPEIPSIPEEPEEEPLVEPNVPEIPEKPEEPIVVPHTPERKVTVKTNKKIPQTGMSFPGELFLGLAGLYLLIDKKKKH